MTDKEEPLSIEQRVAAQIKQKYTDLMTDDEWDKHINLVLAHFTKTNINHNNGRDPWIARQSPLTAMIYKELNTRLQESVVQLTNKWMTELDVEKIATDYLNANAEGFLKGVLAQLASSVTNQFVQSVSHTILANSGLSKRKCRSCNMEFDMLLQPAAYCCGQPV